MVPYWPLQLNLENKTTFEQSLNEDLKWLADKALNPPAPDPPTFAELLSLGVAFFTGEVDLTAAATTTIGTIPSGKRLLVLGHYTMVQAVDLSSGSASATIRTYSNGATAILGATGISNTPVEKVNLLGGGNANNTQAHQGALTCQVTSAATCPVATMVVGIFGILFDT